MTELKPCPFCGRVPNTQGCGKYGYYVACDCGIEQSKIYKQKCDAVKHWNRRKTEPQTDEPTWEQVKEYCNKRCLDIVDSAMRKQWYKTEPQTERVETMSCQECKWWFTDSLKHGGYCQSFLYNQECRYEPQERSE